MTMIAHIGSPRNDHLRVTLFTGVVLLISHDILGKIFHYRVNSLNYIQDITIR